MSDGDIVQTIDPELLKLTEVVNLAVKEAQVCFDEKNKSAGRRARKGLLEIATMSKELRKRVLEAMKADK